MSHRYVLLILVSAVAVRLASYYLIYTYAFSPDPDMWLVSLISDSRLLESYTSVWHYLGLAPYSYPVLFHFLCALLKTSLNLSSSDLFLVNLVFPVVTLASVYLMVKSLRGQETALMSTFALSVSPIFVFETLLNTFKAKQLSYALVALELWSAISILRGRRGAVALFPLILLTSVFTYREALPMGILILAVLASCILANRGDRSFVENPVYLRLAVVLLSAFGALIFTVSYVLYTPSLGVAETIVSSLIKQGPLLLFCIAGAFYALKGRTATDRFILTLTLVPLSTALINWKAGDSAPIFLAPLAGVGLVRVLRAPNPAMYIKVAKRNRSPSVLIILVGLATTVFGLTYYPAKYYVMLQPQAFDEIDQIHRFIAGKAPQRGAVIYGTGYTGVAVGETYASMIVVGPEQRLFYYMFNLHRLVSTDFDPWMISHPELTYDSTLQLYKSLFSHSGVSLDRFFRNFSVQYLIVEKDPIVDKWTETNRRLLEERLVTRNYRVYEIASTRPQVQLLSFIEQHLPTDAKILAPYSMSCAIGQLRDDDLTRALEETFNLNYIHLYERFTGGPNRSRELSLLKARVKVLNDLYSNPKELVLFAKENGFSYVVSDRKDISTRLSELSQRLMFENEDISLFETLETSGTCQAGRSVTAATEPSTLVVNVFETISYSPHRYALSGPAQDCLVKLERDGLEVRNGCTDSSGTIVFSVAPGEYVASASRGELAAKVRVQVSTYAFTPILLHHAREDPTGTLLPFAVLLNSALAIAPTVVPMSWRRRANWWRREEG